MTMIQPSKNIVSIIGGMDESQYRTISTGFRNAAAISTTMRAQIIDYHTFVTERFPDSDLTKEMINRGYNVLMEALYNAIVHGAKNIGDVSRALFLGPLGFAQGFHDGGDFFATDGIEKYFKMGGPIIKSTAMPKHFTHRGGNVGGGITSIRAFSDYVEINKQERILYTVNLLN